MWCDRMRPAGASGRDQQVVLWPNGHERHLLFCGGAAGGTRTRNLPLRRRMLYPLSHGRAPLQDIAGSWRADESGLPAAEARAGGIQQGTFLGGGATVAVGHL